MGQWFIEYHLPESGHREYVFFSAFFCYRLAEGVKLPIRQRSAWCPKCKTFVVAEDVPSMAALEEESHELESGDANLLQKRAFITNGETTESLVAELPRRIEWRQGRASPPRCLHCGACGVVHVPMNGEFRHPQSGERVIGRECGWADTVPWVAEFSPEGEKLPEAR